MFIILKKNNIAIFFVIIITFALITTICLDNILFAKDELLCYPNNNQNLLTDEIYSQLQKIYKQDQKIAYLTFDDGPTPKVTPKVLDILEKTEIKANFFVVGKHVDTLPNLVKREYYDGHFIANHGYSHNNNKLYKSKESFLNEVIKTDLSISNAIGLDYKSHIFRFPNGSMSKNHHKDKMNAINYLKEIDYTYLDWNCLNNDSIKKYSKDGLLKNLKSSSKNKNVLVILMHDTGDVNNTYDILEDSINYLKNEGYEFRTFYDFILK